MKQPLVSVIIPNYNYAHYLPETLNSVLAQSYPRLEIIVVDDGSQDNSQNVIKSYGARVRLIQQKNQGVSAARNRGVQESTGELVAFLDADDVWLPNKLECQVRRILDDREIGLVHCGLEEVDSSGNVIGVRLDGMEGSVSKEMLLFNRPVILGAGSTALIPRETFDAVGGFDTRLSTSADWEFCYRVAFRQPVAFVPEVLVRYRAHGSNMHSNIKLMEHDMLLGYTKAFRTDDVELLALRRHCYGNIHMVLAGSYFRSGQAYGFARHAFKSLWRRPANLKRLLEFPLRRIRDRGTASGGGVKSISEGALQSGESGVGRLTVQAFFLVEGKRFVQVIHHHFQTALYRWGWDTRCRNLIPARILKAVLRDIPARTEPMLLDIGCGQLGVAAFLPHVQVLGTDIDPPVASTPNLTFQLGSITALPFGDRSFPLVSCIDVLEHLSPQDRERGINELVRVATNAILVAYPHGKLAADLDEEFRRDCELHGKVSPSWLVEHQRQPYPVDSTIVEQLNTAVRATGRKATISLSYCEPVNVSRIVRWAAARSYLLYAAVNLVFGALLPFIRPPNDINGYRTIAFIELSGGR